MSKEGMVFSIIVPVRNAEASVSRTIESILSQRSQVAVELIVVDGDSTDGTLRQVERFGDQIDIVISEPDSGLYDAINKGIGSASGDVIGILNGDDAYAHPNVLSLYHEAFRNPDTDLVFADVVYFAASRPDVVRRLYSSAKFHPAKLRNGWMPPHPTVFLRKEAYEQVGCYQTDYEIAADFEFLVRALLVHRLSYARIDSVAVRMQLGGISTSGLRATYTLNKEIIRSCRENGIDTNWLRILSKYPAKFKEFLHRP